MLPKVLLLIVGCFVPYSQSTHGWVNYRKGVLPFLQFYLTGHHNIHRRSFNPIQLDNGFGNTMVGNNMIAVDSRFLPAVPFHSYLPYPTVHHGPLPGPYPPAFGQSHHHHQGHSQYNSHSGHGYQECSGYSCKPKTQHHQYVSHNYHNNQGHEKGYDYDICDHPEHQNLGPHEHNENENSGTGKVPVTSLPPVVITKSTAKPSKAKTSAAITTISATVSTTPQSTQGPIYDIDIRFAKN